MPGSGSTRLISMPGITAQQRFGDVGHRGRVARRIGRGHPDQRLRHLHEARQAALGLVGESLAGASRRRWLGYWLARRRSQVRMAIASGQQMKK